MMKLRYISDLHLEFIRPHKLERFLHNMKLPNPASSEEICILAGDIGIPTHSSHNYDTFMKRISQSFKKTFVIAGNHEYYHASNTIAQTNEQLSEYFKQYENISFLNNSCEQYENHCFVGTTLWSKIVNPRFEINDVYSIPQLDYLKYNRMNMLAVDFLEDAVEQNELCIVITHHVPSHQLIDVKYKNPKMLPYNQWFYCDMDAWIEKKKDKLSGWVYGHTHTSSFQVIHGVPFLCNPIGYPNELAKPDFQKTFEL
jgi:predicted phosphohydrolase